MDKAVETGLKLRILDRSIWDALPKSYWLRGLLMEGSSKSQAMEATYYDTPARTLWTAGYAFRIRREGSERIATLKGLGRSGGGLHQRREWNVPLLDAEAGLEALDRMPGAERVANLLQGQPGLEILFKTVFTRWSALVHSPTGSGLMELAMDKGFISAGDKVEDLFEAEIGLKTGTLRDLMAFGAELSRRFPLMPEEKSTYYRGLCLADLKPVQEESCENTWPPTTEAFLSEAVETVLKAQAAYYSEPVSAEKLHDLRVALRKMRSRLSFVAPLFPLAEGLHWKEVLRTWSRRMARIRELDMLQEEWDIAAGYLGIENRRCPLTLFLKAKRETLSMPFYKTVAKGKMTADLLAFWSWAAGAGKDGTDLSHWRDYSTRRLIRWLKKLGKLAKEVDVSDSAAMHGLRIRGKRARYLLERQIQCWGTPDTIRVAGELRQLQDCLGDIQDSVQGNQMIQKMVQGKHKMVLIKEIGCLSGWQARRGHDALHRFGFQRDEFRKALKAWLKSKPLRS